MQNPIHDIKSISPRKEASLNRVARNISFDSLQIAQHFDRPRPGALAPNLRSRYFLRNPPRKKPKRISKLPARSHLHDEMNVIGHYGQRADLHTEAILSVANQRTNRRLVPAQSRAQRLQDEVIRSAQREGSRALSRGIFLFFNEGKLFHSIELKSKNDAADTFALSHKYPGLIVRTKVFVFISLLLFSNGAMGSCVFPGHHKMCSQKIFSPG